MGEARNDAPILNGEAVDCAAYYAAIIAATPNATIVLTLDFAVVSVNPSGLALLDLETYRPRWVDLWPAALAEQVEHAAVEAAAGRAVRFRAFITRSDGAARWLDTTLTPVGVNGRTAGFIATLRDVTVEIETQSFLDNIVEYVPVAIFAKDAADGRYLMANLAAEKFLEADREEVIGRTDAQFMGPERAARAAAAARTAIESGSYSNEVAIDLVGGTKTFHVRLMTTYGDEGARHVIGVAEDITDQNAAAEALRRAAEQADAANRSKSEFLANMSHEIRTPLNGVVGVADVLARTELSRAQHDMVEIIRSSGVTLERLLSDVLDLARIESGHVEIEAEPFLLHEAVRAIAGLLAMRAQEKGVALTLHVDPQAEVCVIGDVVRLKQILTNLLSNAVKFTERGEVRLTVSAPGPGADTYRFEVQDSGVGFDASQKDRVFGRFQQADGSITRRFGGTGLGLAISRQLSELMGGDLDCRSTPGEGSTFIVELPLARAANDRLQTLDADARTYGARSHSGDRVALRVLLADDHPINRKVVELILAQVGIALTSVEDGAAAVEAFETGDFDVVLMDMQMPVMDGLTATREIRRRERLVGRDSIPILMLTANALAEHVEAGRVAGADGHLTKPITAEKLLGALADVPARSAALGPSQDASESAVA